MSLSNNLKRHGRSISDICGMGLDRIKLGAAAYLQESNRKVAQDNLFRNIEIDVEFEEELAALKKRANKISKEDQELAAKVRDVAFDEHGNLNAGSSMAVLKLLRENKGSLSFK